MRFFNTTGPCIRKKHYMVETSSRLQGVAHLIDMENIFVIHASHQSGKTTYILDLLEKLKKEKKYHAVYCSLEGLQGITEAEKSIPLVIESLKEAFRIANIPKRKIFAKNANYSNYAGVLNIELSKYCDVLNKPLVILFDETDCLSDSALISFLRQLRLGFINKTLAPFLHSVVLAGLRNFRYYKSLNRTANKTMGNSTPFDVIKKTLLVKTFTKAEINSLYKQHTDETGQIFDTEAIDYIYEQTQGQPWLVNTIAAEIIYEILQSNYSQRITKMLAYNAIQNLITRRDTHVASLFEHLKEERVRKVIEPLILGEHFYDRLSDEFLYVSDLGLISDKENMIQPANPIYGEVIARMLCYDEFVKFMIEKPESVISNYLKDNKIDVDFIMQDFQQFWIENSVIWIENFFYKDAAPNLILQAFLQRIINGKGSLIREMAAGAGRTDLYLIYGDKKYPIQLKYRRGDKSLNEGIEQSIKNMNISGCTESWLVLFDRRPAISWEEKIYIKKETVNGKTITVIGL